MLQSKSYFIIISSLKLLSLEIYNMMCLKRCDILLLYIQRCLVWASVGTEYRECIFYSNSILAKTRKPWAALYFILLCLMDCNPDLHVHTNKMYKSAFLNILLTIFNWVL